MHTFVNHLVSFQGLNLGNSPVSGQRSRLGVVTNVGQGVVVICSFDDGRLLTLNENECIIMEDFGNPQLVINAQTGYITIRGEN